MTIVTIPEQDKEIIVEKAPEIIAMEKQEKGKVKIAFTNEEKAPIQSIKPSRKMHQMAEKGHIQEEKIAVIEEKPKTSNLPIETINKIMMTKEAIASCELDGETHTFEEPSIEDLEKELKEKRKLLKQKKKEQEEKERLEAEQKAREEEAKLKLQQGQIQTATSVTPIIPIPIIQKVKLFPTDEPALQFCPICKSKIKKNKVIQQGFVLKQFFKCRNKLCNFQKEIAIKI